MLVDVAQEWDKREKWESRGEQRKSSEGSGRVRVVKVR
jgi:hypothetical protein